MTDPEELLRTTFRRREGLAPSADSLPGQVRRRLARSARRRRVGAVVLGAACVALIAAVPATSGFGLLDSTNGPAGQQTAQPTTSLSVTPSPTPADKCSASTLRVGTGNRRFWFRLDDVPVARVQVGDEIYISGASDLCQVSFAFDGAPISELLKPAPGGKGWFRAVSAGSVAVTASKPPCTMDTILEGTCLADPEPVGSVEIVIEPEPVLPAPDHDCTPDEIAAKAESEGAGSFHLMFVTVSLRGSDPCRLRGLVEIEVTDGDGAVEPMPGNPGSHRIDRVLRSRNPVVATWLWDPWFCDWSGPYTVTFEVLGGEPSSAPTVAPGCPTEGGAPAPDPAGLRFWNVMTLDRPDR